MDFAGTRRRRAVRRRRGPRPDDRARLRPARARLRGAARGRRGRRGAHGHDHLPRRLRRRASSPARRPSSRSRSRRSRPRSCPTLDDDLAAEAGLRHARRAARGHPRAPAPRPRPRRSRPSSARPRSTPPSPGATVDVPDALVEARARELWDQMLHSLSHQGIDREAYLRISGKHRGGDRRGGQAGRRRRRCAREAVLAAIVEAEGIEPTEEEMLEARRRARRRGATKRRRSCSSACAPAGRLDALKDDLAQRKALDLLAESAKPIRSSRPRRATSCGPRAGRPEALAALDAGPDPAV